MEQWIIFALIVCLISSIEVTNFKFISNNCDNNIELIICLGFVVAGLISLLYLISRKDDVKKIQFNKKVISGIIIFGALIVFGRYFFVNSVKLSPNMGYSHIIVNLNVILTLLFGYLLFKQKINKYTLLGILLCILGLFIVIKNC